VKATDKANTKDHLLDIAERHFAAFGFAGTSLRGIIKEADVNVAAVAYHFGGKEDLFSAVIERFALPVVQQQLTRLESELGNKEVQLRDVLLAFYDPPIRLIERLGKKGEILSLFLGRAQTEPDPVYSLIDKHYADCRNRFIAAFRQLTPGLTESDYQWNFEFMLSLIVCFLTRQKPIRKRYEDNKDWNANEVIERLISFSQAGMQSRCR
jgi:AcrR family transcriptional regulator